VAFPLPVGLFNCEMSFPR